MLQVGVEATDLLLVKAVTDNLEVSHNETEAKDLSIVDVSFRIIDIREAHPNKTVLNMAITANPQMVNGGLLRPVMSHIKSRINV